MRPPVDKGGGAYFFYNDWEKYQSKGLLLFSRSDASQSVFIALNFTDSDATVPFTFQRGGSYQEWLHGASHFAVTAGGEALQLSSNYGRGGHAIQER